MGRPKLAQGNAVVIKASISPAAKEKLLALKNSGPMAELSESAFVAYLVGLGIRKYEEKVLPTEMGDESSNPKSPRQSDSEFENSQAAG